MIKFLLAALEGMIMGLAVVFLLVGFLYTCAQRVSGAEVDIKIQRGAGTGYGRSIKNQHYNPLDVNEFTADVYEHMYNEYIPRIPRREDRTRRNVFDDDVYEIEFRDKNK